MESSAIAGNFPHARVVLRFIQFALLVLAVAALAACANQYRFHGYAPTDLDLKQVQVGKDTRDSVTEKVGRPSAEGLLNDDAWFFVQSKFVQRGIKPPKEIERQVVVIRFSDAGTVSNVERFGLANGEVIAISRRVTETNIKDASFLRQILGNIGNFSASQVLGGGNSGTGF